MKETVYKWLAYIQRIVLPAIGTLYAALGKIWAWPYVAEIVGTIAAITVFLGAILQIDSEKYFSDKQIINK